MSDFDGRIFWQNFADQYSHNRRKLSPLIRPSDHYSHGRDENSHQNLISKDTEIVSISVSSTPMDL